MKCLMLDIPCQQKKKKAFCDFLREIKFPDGFASNISRCLNAEETKVQGLKHMIATFFYKESYQLQ